MTFRFLLLWSSSNRRPDDDEPLVEDDEEEELEDVPYQSINGHRRLGACVIGSLPDTPMTFHPGGGPSVFSLPTRKRLRRSEASDLEFGAAKKRTLSTGVPGSNVTSNTRFAVDELDSNRLFDEDEDELEKSWLSCLVMIVSVEFAPAAMYE
jgi:hypothetical protein